MPNPFTLDAGDLPDPLETVVRRVIRHAAEQYVGQLHNAQNVAIAHAAANTLVSQGFGGTTLQYTGANTTACEWRVPYIGDLFSDIQPEARASAAGGNGTVRWESATSGAGVEVAFAAGASAWRTPGVLDIGNGGPESVTPYDTVSFIVGGAGTVTVDSVHLRHVPRTSPLPAGVYNGVAPWGADSMIADTALSAAHGRRLRTNIEKVRQRPRMLMCVSGLAAGLLSVTDLPSLAFRPIVQPRRGAFELGRSYTVWVKAQADAVDDTYVVLKATGVDDWPDIQGTVMTIAAGGGLGWHTTTIRLPEIEGVPSMLPYEALQVGIWPAGPAGPLSGRTTASVRSISIWGE